MSFDIQKARQETPGCWEVLHFNNAGSALMPQPVFETIISYLQEEYMRGGYETVLARSQQLEHAYDACATLLNCQREEIAIIENATRAWDMAFYSIPFSPGDRILTGMDEYASNYIALLQVARKTGAVIDVIPNDESGQISLTALRNAIDERVKLIALTHVPTNSGLVNPAKEVGQIAREAGVLYLLDACQSIGQMPLDVQAISCDFLSATGRKFLRAPRGTGLLYVRKSRLEQLEPPFLDLHAAEWTTPDHYQIRDDARRFENWETNFAGKVGLGVAIDYALNWGLETIQERVTSLAIQLRTQLQTLPGITLRDIGVKKCGIVTFQVQDKMAEQIREGLAQHSINVSVSGRSSTRLDMEARGLEEVVRASVHYYNTEEEIERFCTVLTSL
jgi:selenocysteine lyase/cysteine desulfurase